MDASWEDPWHWFLKKPTPDLEGDQFSPFWRIQFPTFTIINQLNLGKYIPVTWILWDMYEIYEMSKPLRYHVMFQF